MANILEYVNKKYNFNLSSIDTDIAFNSFFELIDILIEGRKRVSLSDFCVNYFGKAVDMNEDIFKILSAKTDLGIDMVISDKFNTDISAIDGLSNRSIFKNIGYLSANKLTTPYTDDIYMSYIPVKDWFSFDVVNICFTGYQAYNSILASIYAKNCIVKDFADIIKSNPSTFESLKTYLDERLAEDDIEMAQGYLNAVSVENTTPQAINQMQSALIEMILKDIQSEIGGLQ